MITKPEEACFVAAVTRGDLLEQGFGGGAELQLFIAQANAQPMVTAKQCAEIARAYGYACIHSFMAEEDEKVRKFDALFEQWEKGQ